MSSEPVACYGVSANVSLPEILGTAAAVVAIGGGAFGVSRGVGVWYRRTIGSRRILTARLNQLAAGVTTRWVEERLGPPTFVGDFRVPPWQAVEAAPAEPIMLRELIYRTKHAWIQILADDNETVARFSITVTDPRFRFPVRDLTFYHLHARLGHSRFSDIRTQLQPDGRVLSIAARRYEYAESYWFGNPGSYQRYVLSHNDAGIGMFDFSIMQHGGPSWCREGFLGFDDAPPVSAPPFDSNAPYAIRFRAETNINTLTVLGPLMPPTAMIAPRGPNADQVRVLVPDARERRRLRRRVHKLSRQAEREIRHQARADELSTPEGHAHDSAAS